MKQKTKSKEKIQILIEISFMITVTFQISREKINHLISKLRQMANHLEK